MYFVFYFQACVRVCELYTKTLPKSVESWCLPSLKKLELWRTIRVTDQLMTSICSNCVNLEKLVCGNVSGLESLRMMSSLKKLSVLSLRSCHVVSKSSAATKIIYLFSAIHDVNTFDVYSSFQRNNEDLVLGLCPEVNKTLKEVDFELSNGQPEFFVEFARTHPAVTRLSLVRCNYFDDASLGAVFVYQVKIC